MKSVSVCHSVMSDFATSWTAVNQLVCPQNSPDKNTELVSHSLHHIYILASQLLLVVKNPPANAGDTGDMSSSPGSGRSHEAGNVNPLQYSCLVDPMNRGPCRATAHGVAKIQIWLSTHITTTTHIHIYINRAYSAISYEKELFVPKLNPLSRRWISLNLRFLFIYFLKCPPTKKKSVGTCFHVCKTELTGLYYNSLGGFLWGMLFFFFLIYRTFNKQNVQTYKQ